MKSAYKESIREHDLDVSLIRIYLFLGRQIVDDHQAHRRLEIRLSIITRIPDDPTESHTHIVYRRW